MPHNMDDQNGTRGTLKGYRLALCVSFLWLLRETLPETTFPGGKEGLLKAWGSGFRSSSDPVLVRLLLFGFGLTLILALVPLIRTTLTLLRHGIADKGAPEAPAGFQTSGAKVTDPASASLHARECPAAGEEGREVEDGAPQVLLVGIDYKSQTLCLEVLESCGCQPTVVSTGAAGILRMSCRKFHLVLIDWGIPCLEFAEHLRSGNLRDQQGWIPILVLAPQEVILQERNLSLMAGINGWLAKPLTADVLRGMLAQWVPQLVSSGGCGTPDAYLLSPCAGNTKREPGATAGLVGDPPVLDDGRETDGSAKVLAPLVERFLDEAPRYLQDLHNAVDREAWLEVRKAAHALRASSALVGARFLADLCQNLAGLSVEEGGIEAYLLLKRIETLCFQVCSKLEGAREQE